MANNNCINPNIDNDNFLRVPLNVSTVSRERMVGRGVPMVTPDVESSYQVKCSNSLEHSALLISK